MVSHRSAGTRTPTKQASHPHTACGQGNSSEERARVPTHSVWKTNTPREAQRRQQVTTCTALKKERSFPSQLSVRLRRKCQTQWCASFPRAQSALLAMQLSDIRQSRDECHHGRTQLWVSATRELMPQGDITQTAPSMVTPVKDSSRRSSRCRRAQMNRAVPQDQDPKKPKPDGSSSARMIPKRKARSPTMRPRRRATV